MKAEIKSVVTFNSHFCHMWGEVGDLFLSSPLQKLTLSCVRFHLRTLLCQWVSDFVANILVRYLHFSRVL